MSTDEKQSSDFIPTASQLPPEGALVDWITPSGKQVDGGGKGPGRLWLLPPDWSVYCYYEPIAWRLHNEH